MSHAACFAALLVVVAAAGCHSAGPYGHSVNYAPTSDEAKAVGPAREYDPVMFQRFPEQWRGKPVTLFGVVMARGAGPSGGAYVTLGVRRLEPRNLCLYQEDEDSCRVTVSDTDFGDVHANVPLADTDDTSADAVRPGSLLRVVGTFGEDVDPTDGAAILHATFYRHWPPGTYVTRAAAKVLRQ